MYIIKHSESESKLRINFKASLDSVVKRHYD